MINHTRERTILRTLLGTSGLLAVAALAAAGCYDGGDAWPTPNKRSSEITAGADRGPSCRDDKDASPPDVAPAADADAGCACAPGDPLGSQSFSCFCADDPCLSYDEAIRLCPPSPFPEDNRIDIHAACNLVVIEYGGYDYGRYVYDATTHALVGAMYGTDYDAYICGSTRVFGVQAGKFPPSDCPVSQSAFRCVNGG